MISLTSAGGSRFDAMRRWADFGRLVARRAVFLRGLRKQGDPLGRLFSCLQEVQSIRNRNRTNRDIRAREVRLIGPNGEQVGIVPTREALAKAQEAGLDLVEVAPEAKPPVCKIEDYTKIVYQKKRQAREARKKQKAQEIKEVKVRPNCDPHDFGIKMNRAIKFLDKGMKVKLTMMFRGREIATASQRAQVLKEKVLEALVGHGEMESMSRTTVRTATMLIGPVKKKDPTSKKQDNVAAEA